MKRMLLLLTALFSMYDTNAQVKVYHEYSVFEKEILSVQHSDTVYVINFWATWCKPCIEELIYFEHLKNKYEEKPTKVILVSLDMKDKITTMLIPFIERRNIKSKVVVLADSKVNTWIDLVDPSWSGAIPATVIIYRHTKSFFEKSYSSQEELEHDIINQIVK